MEALEQRLGPVDELAEAAEAGYFRRTIFGRHPVMTFLIAPAPALIFGWALFMAAALLLFKAAPLVLGSAFDTAGRPVAQWPTAMVALAWGLHWAARFLPPALLALFFWWLTSRSGLSWRWSLAACALVALLAGAYTSQLQLPVAPGEGTLTIGLGISSSPSLLQWGQFAVPALIGVVSAWRLASMRPTARTA